ncbi:TBC1 domain family member 31-like [Nilaparvata lugens]|uniref:TBC1 domain family member 31-like n=1 Tax=Nilaparvata lugens TaxID=108931 RepID=UPI00193C9C14|nr:TBC1 domain family member 31-like [Nilaparvata lugens]
MSMMENILVEWDEQLFNWLVEHQLSPTHLCRSTLLSIDNSKDFEFFFHNQTAIDMRWFLRKTYHIYGRTKDDDLHPRNFLMPFAPLRQGETYQIFNEYPKFNVDKQADHINEMREELTDLLEQQSRLARARAEQEKKHALEINRQAQKMQLLDLQKQYQDTLKEDESRISQQKKRVNLLKRDLKQRELLMAEEARNRTYDLITQQRTAALQALIHEIDSKRAVEERRLREVEEETLERHQQLLHEKQQMEQQLAVLAEAPIPVVSKQDQLGVQLDQLTEQLIKIRSKTSQMNEKRDFRKSRNYQRPNLCSRS